MRYHSPLKRYKLSSHKKTWKNFNAYFSVKEFNLKSLYTALFQLYDTLEKMKPVRQLKEPWLLRVKG